VCDCCVCVCSCAVLPHLTSLVEIIQGGLEDEQGKVRTICALSLVCVSVCVCVCGVWVCGVVSYSCAHVSYGYVRV